MTENLIKEFEGSLWSDFKNELKLLNKDKLLLAHYTSIHTLQEVLKNEEIWLSNPFYMNDTQELEYGLEVSARLIRENKNLYGVFNKDSDYDHLVEKIDFWFNGFNNKDAFNTYIFCLSEHRDNDGLLSMWRGYGDNGNGTAVVINMDNLEIIEGSPLIFAKVKYESNENRETRIIREINKFAEILKKIMIILSYYRSLKE